MTSFNDFKNSFCDLANDTKRDLAWIAAIHVALKSRQQDILPLAGQLLTEPESSLGVQNLPPVEAKKEHDKAVELFRAFGNCVRRGPSDDVGHYLNKSAVLYADSILQGFLDRTYEIIACFKKLPKKQLTKNSISGKLNEIGSRLPELSTARHAKFIAQLRHIITHNNGFVNDDFLKKCGINLKTMKEGSNEKRLWDTQIWPNAHSFLECYKPPENESRFPASLDIMKVITPYLKHSIEFVDEVLRKALEKYKPSP